MPPKKADKKQKPAKDGSSDQPNLIEEFVKIYRRIQRENNSTRFAPIEELISAAEESEKAPTVLNLSGSTVDIASLKATCEALRESRYPVKAIRLWRCTSDGDEAVSSISLIMPSLEELQLCDIKMTKEGCSLISSSFMTTPLSLICLDFNKIGNEGLERLCEGLSGNTFLRSLSLRYCGIRGAEGVRLISPVLAFTNTSLARLFLAGNPLGIDGVKELLEVGLVKARKLKVLDLANTGIVEIQVLKQTADHSNHSEETETISKTVSAVSSLQTSGATTPSGSPARSTGNFYDSLSLLFSKNSSIESVTLHGNMLTSTTAACIVEIVKANKQIKNFTLPIESDKTIVESLAKLLSSRKGKKGKSKK